MKKSSLILLILFIPFAVFTQNTAIDSILGKARTIKNPTDKLNYLLRESKRINRNVDANKMILLLEKIKLLSEQLDNYEGKFESELQLSENYLILEDSINSINYAQGLLQRLTANDSLEYRLIASNQLGRSYYQFRDYEKAIEVYLSGISLYDDSNISVISNLYDNLSTAYRKVDNIEKSISATLKSVEYANRFNNHEAQIQSLYSLGWNYLNLKNYNKAEKYFLEGLEVAKENKLEKFNYLNRGIALCYSRSGRYDKALFHNEKALIHFRKINDKRFIFDVLNNTAVVYNRMGNPKMGMLYAKRALKAAKILNHDVAIFVANHTLAVAYKDLEKYRSAEKIFLYSLRDTLNKNIIDDYSKSSIFSNLGDIYGKIGDYKKAFIYDRMFRKIKDSLTKKREESNFSELETKYQTAKKEKENLQLKVEKAAQAEQLALENKQKWQLGGGLATAILGLGVFFISYKRSEKQKKVIVSLQKELHHRIKNNLAIIDSFIEVAKDNVQDETTATSLSDLQNRIDSINQVHYQLYANQDVTQLNIKNYVDQLVTNVANTFNQNNISINNETAQHLEIHPDKSFPIGLIINEFLTNSFKYAFDDKTGSIDILIEEQGKNYNLILKDSGKGIPVDFNAATSSSYGMRIMKLLSKQLQGTFNLKNNDGLELTIQFPKN